MNVGTAVSVTDSGSRPYHIACHQLLLYLPCINKCC